jgi:hypothetical protein
MDEVDISVILPKFFSVKFSFSTNYFNIYLTCSILNNFTYLVSQSNNDE